MLSRAGVWVPTVQELSEALRGEDPHTKQEAASLSIWEELVGKRKKSHLTHRAPKDPKRFSVCEFASRRQDHCGLLRRQ